MHRRYGIGHRCENRISRSNEINDETPRQIYVGRSYLSLIFECCCSSCLHGLIEIHIVEDQGWVLATQLEGDVLVDLVRRISADLYPCCCTSSERDALDERALHKSRACSSTVT